MWSVYEGRGYINLLLAGVWGQASCSTFHLNAFSCTKNNVARHIDPEAFSTRVKAVVAFRGTWFVPRQCDIMSYELAKHTSHVSKRSRFWGLLRRIRWWCILGKQLSADGSCVWELIHINLEGKRRETCYIACRTGFFVVQTLSDRGTLIAATILKAIEKLIRQLTLSQFQRSRLVWDFRYYHCLLCKVRLTCRLDHEKPCIWKSMKSVLVKTFTFCGVQKCIN